MTLSLKANGSCGEHKKAMKNATMIEKNLHWTENMGS